MDSYPITNIFIIKIIITMNIILLIRFNIVMNNNYNLNISSLYILLLYNLLKP